MMHVVLNNVHNTIAYAERWKGIDLFTFQHGWDNSNLLAFCDFSINFTGLGYTSIMANFLCVVYLTPVMGYMVFYLFASMRAQLPWASCDNSWNTDACTRIHTNVSNHLALTNGRLGFFLCFMLLDWSKVKLQLLCHSSNIKHAIKLQILYMERCNHLLSNIFEPNEEINLGSYLLNMV